MHIYSSPKETAGAQFIESVSVGSMNPAPTQGRGESNPYDGEVIIIDFSIKNQIKKIFPSGKINFNTLN